MGNGSIVRLPAEEWISMDTYYERFENQVKGNGEPVFYCYSPRSKADYKAVAQKMDIVSRQVHISLILYTGMLTVMPELSARYILFRKSKEKRQIGDSLQRHIGDAGREFIVNNYFTIMLLKEEENDVNAIFNYLAGKQNALSCPIVTRFIDNLVSLSVAGVGFAARITHMVASIENILIPEATQNIRKQFVAAVLQVLGDQDLSLGDQENQLLSCYALRNAVVHGQDIYPVINRSNGSIEDIYRFILRVYLSIFLRLVSRLPKAADSVQIGKCLKDLVTGMIPFPSLNTRWQKI